MKIKYLVTLIFILCFQGLSAQFVVSSDGITTQEGKSFYVEEFPDKTADELYKEAMSYITSTFRNPDIVSNTIPNEMINMHAFNSNAFVAKHQKIGNLNWYAHIDYNLIMSFKNGKIRFDVPAINELYIVGSKGEKLPIRFNSGGGFFGDGIRMFDKNGKVKDERCVNGLAQFINGIVISICEYIKNYDSSNDW